MKAIVISKNLQFFREGDILDIEEEETDDGFCTIIDGEAPTYRIGRKSLAFKELDYIKKAMGRRNELIDEAENDYDVLLKRLLKA